MSLCIHLKFGATINSSSLDIIRYKQSDGWAGVVHIVTSLAMFVNKTLSGSIRSYVFIFSPPIDRCPCKNGGWCAVDKNNADGYVCKCRAGFLGEKCESEYFI